MIGAVRVRDVRDGVVLADLPEASDDEANRLCVAAARRLRTSRLRGLRDAIPAARSLLVDFDPARLGPDRVRAELEACLAGEVETHDRRTLIVPVAYVGPDLEELAHAARLTPQEFAGRHSRPDYRVAFLGFAPGFAYLTGLAAELAAARLPTPRTRVPAGSVAIGGPYTGIYPDASPGGWRLIGQATVRLFDPEADEPSLLRAGDRVRFEAVALGDLPAPPARATADARGPAILRLLSPGVAATVQGGPVFGLGSSGVPPGGAMDPVSLGRANALVGNALDAPGLEIGLFGPELEALAECEVGLGGEIDAERNGNPAPANEAFTLARGDRLRLGRVRSGLWGYVAVRGGLAPISRCAPQRRLAAGDTLAGGSARSSSRAVPAPPDPSGELLLRILPGPEADHFAPSELRRLCEAGWRVSGESDRRGLRLEGPGPLAHRAGSEIPPSPTVPGSIQVPGGGFPIVLGPDGPVTGGYPRIATVIGADLPLLGRAAPGAVLRFATVTLAEALEARRLGVP